MVTHWNMYFIQKNRCYYKQILACLIYAIQVFTCPSTYVTTVWVFRAMTCQLFFYVTVWCRLPISTNNRRNFNPNQITEGLQLRKKYCRIQWQYIHISQHRHRSWLVTIGWGGTSGRYLRYFLKAHLPIAADRSARVDKIAVYSKYNIHFSSAVKYR